MPTMPVPLFLLYGLHVSPGSFCPLPSFWPLQDMQNNLVRVMTFWIELQFDRMNCRSFGLGLGSALCFRFFCSLLFPRCFLGCSHSWKPVAFRPAEVQPTQNVLLPSVEGHVAPTLWPSWMVIRERKIKQ